MARAKTALTLGTAWSGRLEILNHDHVGCGGSSIPYSGDGAEPPIKDLTFSALGGTVSIRPYPSYADGLPSVFGDPTQFLEMYHSVAYWLFQVKVLTGFTPEVIDTGLVGLRFGGGPMGSALPAGLIKQPDGNVSIPFSYSVTGLFARGNVVERSHYNRQLMDWSDLASEYGWYCNGSSVVTLQATMPNGHVLTSSSPLGWSAGEYDVTANLGALFHIKAHTMYVPGLPYARIADLKFNGIPVDTSNCELYLTGSDAPDTASNPSWGRTPPVAPLTPGFGDNRLGNNGGGIAMWSNGAEANYTQTTGEYYGRVGVPNYLKLVPRCGKFDDRTPYPELQFTSSPIDWAFSAGAWHSTPTVFGPAGITRQQQSNSWSFPHEWQTIDGNVQTVQVHQPWRVDAGEDVGATTPATNDQQCGLLKYPLTASGLTGDPFWGPLLTLTHLTSIDMNDPAGLSLRPSLWTSGGTGVTVDGGDNDSWAVAAGTASPRITRALKTRYYWRMEALADLADDPELPHNPDWPIILRANLSEAAAQDRHWWHDIGQGGIAGEDVTNIAEFRYLRLGIRAARQGTATVKLTYSIVNFDDPVTTCFEHRYGLEGTWEWTRSAGHVLTYIVPLLAGPNTCDIDLCLNAERITPRGENRLQHVDSIEIILPANTGTTPDAYTLTHLTPLLDPGGANRTAPTEHVTGRVVRNWAWLPGKDEDGNPQWGGTDGLTGEKIELDWFGFGAVTDGLEGLEVNYGYEHSWGFTRHERKLLYLGHRKHCPLEEDQSSMLDYAKQLSELGADVSYVEGWTSDYPSPLVNAANRDADGLYFAGALYWWDLLQGHNVTAANVLPFLGAVCVGTGLGALPGIEQEQHFYAYPRGNVAGLAFNKAHTKCFRGEGVVTLWGRVVGDTAWISLGDCTPNEHGYFETSNQLEKEWEYSLRTQAGTANEVVTLANREHTWQEAVITEALPGNPATTNRSPIQWLAVATSDGLKVRPLHVSTWAGEITLDPSPTSLSVEQLTTGALILTYARDGAVRQIGWQGGVWSSETMLASDRSFPTKRRLVPTNDLMLLSMNAGTLYARRGVWGSGGYAWQAEVVVATDAADVTPAVEPLRENLIHVVYMTSGGDLAEKNSTDRGATWA